MESTLHLVLRLRGGGGDIFHIIDLSTGKPKNYNYEPMKPVFEFVQQICSENGCTLSNVRMFNVG